MKISTFFLTSAALCLGSNAAIISIDTLDVRSDGIFGHPDATAVTINGNAPGSTVTADPITIQLTYQNLDLDGDGTANDSVTFSLIASGGTNQRIFNQGIDTGFGSLEGVTMSVSNVSGLTTDLNQPIVFDGFTGADIGAGVGGGAGIDVTTDINGTPVSIVSPDTGAFQFSTAGVDFTPAATVVFDNTVNNSTSSLVARSYDLQFSSIPEPSSALLLGLATGFLALRRRK